MKEKKRKHQQKTNNKRVNIKQIQREITHLSARSLVYVMSSDIFLLEFPSGAQRQMAEKKARLQFCLCQRRGEFPTMVKKVKQREDF